MTQQPLPAIPLFKPKKKIDIPPLSTELAWVVELTFLAVAVLFFLLGKTSPWKDLIGNISINFLAIILEALPFMLIGSLAGGIIEMFVSVDWIERVFRQRKTRAVFLAGSMGLFFPVCECAIVPVVRRLLGKGIPFGAAITFLLAGPIVNVIVAASTAIAYSFDWSFVIIRLASGYIIAVVVGLLLGRFFTRENGLIPSWKKTSPCACGHDHDDTALPLSLRLRHAIEHASDDFFDVGRYLVIGAFIAALMRSTVSMATFTDLMGSPWLAILLMMVMAVILNLCSEADAFIAASFRELLPGSAQMAFMVMGPMLDIKLILMYFSVFRKRVILSLIATVTTTVLLAMLGLEYLSVGLL
ncbi:MAG: permease [Thermodesulfobacteriota bacterium]|nr:permease [Thermodesulfobacteriota bacterium]